MGVGGVKIEKMESQSQTLSLSLLDYQHFLLSHPLDFITFIVSLSQKGLIKPMPIPILTSSWAGRPKVEFVLCLRWVTVTIRKPRRHYRWPWDWTNELAICRLGSWSHTSIGWLLVWCHKGPALTCPEVLWASVWTRWKALTSVICVYVSLCTLLKKTSWFPAFPVLGGKSVFCTVRAWGFRAEKYFVLSCGGS